MKPEIRSFHMSDLCSLYHICLKTGDSGKDAEGLYRDPDLLGHVYAAPFALLEPDLCFVVTLDNQPAGYILGCRDSQEFHRRSMNEWFTFLQTRYPYPPETDSSKDAVLIRKIYEGHTVKKELTAYPAHLHIDILPAGQGLGLGKALIQIFTDTLRRLKVPALHLEVGKRNSSAIGFYEKVGFSRICEYEYSIAFGMDLS